MKVVTLDGLVYNDVTIDDSFYSEHTFCFKEADGNITVIPFNNISYIRL